MHMDMKKINEKRKEERTKGRGGMTEEITRTLPIAASPLPDPTVRDKYLTSSNQAFTYLDR